MKILVRFALLWVGLVAAPAQAAINVLACEPEWAALAQEIAGNKARVTSATTPNQDPHRIEARPSLIARARVADLVICTGAELEIGWLPLLLSESGNARIRPGAPGYLEVARHVPLIEKPDTVDRSMGDVHASGNPHLHLDPRNLILAAGALSARLVQLDASNAAWYTARTKDFQARMSTAIERWQGQAAALKNVPVAVHHKTWSYLLVWLEMRATVDLEPKPGVDPSVAYLGQVLNQIKTTPVKMVLYANYFSPRASQWLSERAKVPAVQLPYTVGGSPGARDLFGLFDDLIAKLLAGAA